MIFFKWLPKNWDAVIFCSGLMVDRRLPFLIDQTFFYQASVEDGQYGWARS
jgi:hypothetical protein